VLSTHKLEPVGQDNGEAVFEARFVPPLSGLITYKLRVYPDHPLLCHRFETGCLKWV